MHSNLTALGFVFSGYSVKHTDQLPLSFIFFALNGTLEIFLKAQVVFFEVSLQVSQIGIASLNSH